MNPIAVVIVSYRSEAAAAAAARAVSNEADVAGVTVVDNSAHEQRAERVAFEDLGDRIDVLRPGQNLGYAAGNNLGIESALKAGCQYVLVLNPDAVLAPGAVSALLDELRGSSTHMVSPALVEIQQGQDIVLRNPGFDLLLGRGVLEAPASRRFVPTFFGAAFLARAQTFEQFGLLDEQLFLYCEEVEYVERLRRRGERAVFRVARDVVVRHDRGGSVSPGGYDPASRSTVAFEEASRSVIVFGRKYHPARVPLWTLARLAMASRLLLGNPRAAAAVVRGVARGFTARTVANRDRR